MLFDPESDNPFRWAPDVSMADKIACVLRPLLKWVDNAEVDSGKRTGIPTETANRQKALEREPRELRRFTETLRKESLYVAQGEGGVASLRAMPERSTTRSNDNPIYRG